ncbi:MAG TPA: response regulator, partial [bacterium]|nr:response regulator [bacterium]
GLGLALAKTAVEAMGGTIGATSQRGIGSSFWVELPLAEDRAPEAETGVDSSAEASHLTNNLRVLYVEDNLPNAQLMRRILRRRPALELLVARTGREAVDVIARELPDIVLLDVHLPDFSGLELLSRVRELPGGERRPVIVVSADATPEQVERFLRAGARHYVTKPVRTQAFLVALDETVRWMEGAAAEDATGEGGTET